MNWRLLTAINAGIPLITVSAVIFGIRGTRPQRARNVRRQNIAAQSNSAEAKFDDKEARNRVEALTDISNARVDDLGAVPAAELTHLMDRATPEQLAALALKFNDAPTDARTFGGMAAFFQAWTQLDPKTALGGAFQLRDVTMRKLAATAVVNSTSPSAAPELIAMLVQHPDGDLKYECKDAFLEPLIENWSSLDPEAAAKYMDDLGDTKNRVNSAARQKIAYNWGTLDPAAALEWVAKQKDKDFVNQDSLADGVVNGWCLKDLSAASEYVRQHIDDPSAGNTASSVATAMFSHDPQRAMNWVNGLPDGEARESAETSIAYGWADKDPATGAQWLTTLPQKDQGTVVGTIIPAWIEQNSAEAFHWISTLTGDVHDDAIVAAMNRDGVTSRDSLSLVFQINDPGRQNSVMGNTVRSWAYNDAEAAEAWVKGSSLSPEQQQRLLKVISDTQPTVSETPAEEVNTDH